MEAPWVGDFQTLTSVEVAKIDKQMASDFQSILVEAAGRGTLGSSRLLIGLQAAAARTIPVKARLGFSVLLRTLEAYGVSVTDENKKDLAAFLADWMEHQKEVTESKMLETGPFKQNFIGNWDGPLLGELKNVVEDEKIRCVSELNLISARNARVGARPDGAQVFNFNAPVNMVQAGPGSYGIANQHIDGAAKAELTAALDKLLSALGEAKGDADVPEADVRELVAETKTEVAKENPNISRLRGLLSGLGEAISYAPKLRSAYDTLKWAGGMIGVNLP